MASNAYKNEEGIVGVPSGLKDLDDRLGGMHKSDLIILAGRPGMGKTALATNIAFHAAITTRTGEAAVPVAFFSLEMAADQLGTRILSERAQVDSEHLPDSYMHHAYKFAKTHSSGLKQNVEDFWNRMGRPENLTRTRHTTSSRSSCARGGPRT